MPTPHPTPQCPPICPKSLHLGMTHCRHKCSAGKYCRPEDLLWDQVATPAPTFPPTYAPTPEVTLAPLTFSPTPSPTPRATMKVHYQSKDNTFAEAMADGAADAGPGGRRLSVDSDQPPPMPKAPPLPKYASLPQMHDLCLLCVPGQFQPDSCGTKTHELCSKCHQFLCSTIVELH